MNINICHIYPDLLNLYGDNGNVLCLKKRMEKMGISTSVFEATANTTFDFENFDIFFIGGGQDFDQNVLMKDLEKTKKSQLLNAINRGKVVLAICGGFQILGKYYETYDKNRMNFLGAIDYYTIGSKKRMIGNLCFETNDNLKIVGFENHSGRTYLGLGVEPLGKIIKGFGNNGKDKTEGVHFKNTFGTYCHGPILPKNPKLADKLISLAVENKYGKVALPSLDDSLEEKAFSVFYNNYI